jgi:small subunit ribosomal protein S4
MARYIGPSCKLCRRENMKLYLKGDRCYSDKCAYDRRPYPPGQHGQGRIKFSEYGVRLREKQKVRRMYGLLEKQYHRYFELAERGKSVTGEALLRLLERRLDNITYRMGFGSTRAEARQLVRHSHILVNGKRVNVPSFLVKPGDVVSIHERSRKIKRILEAIETIERRGTPEWLEVEPKEFRGTVKAMPTRESVSAQIQEQLIVEFYSR